MNSRPLPAEQRRSLSRPFVVVVALLLLIGLVQQSSILTSFEFGALRSVDQAIEGVVRHADELEMARQHRRGRSGGGGGAGGLLPGTPVSRFGDDDLHLMPETEDEETSSPLELASLSPLSTIVGWVSDSRGSAVGDAVVRLRFEEGGEDEAKSKGPTTRSLANGTFRIEDVPPGRWTITAEKKGYATAVETGYLVQAHSNQPAVDLRLGEEVILKGTVTANGKPVEGAFLRARRSMIIVGEQGEVSSLGITYSESGTDSKGAYELGQLAPGPMTVVVVARGFARMEHDLTIAPGMKAVELRLESESLLSGVVRDERGRAVEGAKVTLRAANSGPKGQVWGDFTTGESGQFEIGGLPAQRPFDLYATARRYANTGPIPVMSGTSTNVVLMTSGGGITGRVINFETQTPMAGMLVRATSEDGSLPNPLLTQTNSEGVYRLSRLPAGVYQVSISSDRLTADPRGGVRVAANALVRDINLSVYPGLTISGEVVDGDSGQWLPNATVELQGRVGPTFTTNRNVKAGVDAVGLFAFTNLPQGIYTARASLPGYVPGQGVEASVRVELLRGQLVPPIRLRLYRAATIDGTVVDASGSAVANALIQLSHFGGTPGSIPNIHNYKATSSSGGRFRIEGLPLSAETHVRVSAWAEGYPKGQSDRVVLDRTQPNAFTNIVLGRGTPVTVSVRTQDGSNLGDVHVSLAHRAFSDGPPPAWSRRTDATGVVTFNQIPDGSIRVNASRDGYLSTGRDANVSAASGEPITMTLTLEPATTLAGRVVDDRGNPVERGNVTARGLSGATGGGGAGIDPEGRFLIKGLGKGQFWLEVDAIRQTASGQRRVWWAVPRVSPNAGASELQIVVPMTATLVGRVHLGSADPSPPAKYNVSINGTYRDPTGRTRSIGASASFDVGHPFRFDNLPSGEYRVTASAANYLPTTAGPFTVTSPGEFSAGDIHLRMGGTLRGRVLNAQTREPINGALVALKPEGPAARTNAAGHVTISPVTPAIYTVEVSHQEYLGATEHLIHISRGQETDLGDVLLDPGAILGGAVVDGRGNPLRGVTVETRSIEIPTDLRRTSTDASGRYLFRGLVPGGQMLNFTANVNRRPISRSYNISVTAAHPTEHNAILDATATLFGWLAAPPSIDVNRAIVRAYPMSVAGIPNTAQTITTDHRSGSTFRINNLVEGRYLVTVQAPRFSGTHFWSGVVSVTGREARATITAGSNVIEGRILERPGGPPVARQTVRLDFLSTPESGMSPLRNWWLNSVATDSEGFFSFPFLQPGIYSLVASNAEFGRDILDVITIEPGRSHLALEYDFGRKSSPEIHPKTQPWTLEEPYAPMKEVFGGN